MLPAPAAQRIGGGPRSERATDVRRAGRPLLGPPALAPATAGHWVSLPDRGPPAPAPAGRLAAGRTARERAPAPAPAGLGPLSSGPGPGPAIGAERGTRGLVPGWPAGGMG
jgi:hypothetical protein